MKFELADILRYLDTKTSLAMGYTIEAFMMLVWMKMNN